MIKRRFLILIVVFFMGLTLGIFFNVFAMVDKEYSEEIIPVRDSDGNIIGENVIVTILSKVNVKDLLINLSIFDGFKHYGDYDDFFVNIIINNESKYDYYYVEDSFKIKTKVPDDFLNYKTFAYSGFDGLNIYDSYYRTYNDALIFLVGGDDLSDENINNSLISIGYSGIDELNKFYLDYYGYSYNFNKIITGKVSNFKESNMNMVRYAYEYFYTDILKLNINSELMSMYEIIYNNKLNSCFNNSLDIIRNSSSGRVNCFSIKMDKNIAFSNYTYDVDVNFSLKRNRSWEFEWFFVNF